MPLQVIAILEESYASAATYNRLTRVAQFKVDPLDVRSLSNKMFGAIPQVIPPVHRCRTPFAPLIPIQVQ